MAELNKNALIGYSGFVGSTLMKQACFDQRYRSSNIAEIRNRSFDVVFCAGAPAQKWIANKEPEMDRIKILGLIDHLKTIQSKTFILMSTVDVFKDPFNVDEGSPISEDGLNPYGLNRRLLEKFVEEKFSNYLIVRLPGLVGPGLRKNVIFDFLNNNNLSAIDSRGVFQFYPMVNLWFDIQTALRAGLKLVHLTAEPISVSDVSLQGFGKPFQNLLMHTPATYDLRTRYGQLFKVSGNYQYNQRETILAIRAYAQSEHCKIVDSGTKV